MILYSNKSFGKFSFIFKSIQMNKIRFQSFNIYSLLGKYIFSYINSQKNNLILFNFKFEI